MTHSYRIHNINVHEETYTARSFMHVFCSVLRPWRIKCMTAGPEYSRPSVGGEARATTRPSLWPLEISNKHSDCGACLVMACCSRQDCGEVDTLYILKSMFWYDLKKTSKSLYVKQIALNGGINMWHVTSLVNKRAQNVILWRLSRDGLLQQAGLRRSGHSIYNEVHVLIWFKKPQNHSTWSK